LEHKKETLTKISFHYADARLNIPGKNNIKQFIPRLFKKEKHQAEELRYIFCSDEYLLQINRDFLQHDYYTDIITFDLSEKGKGITGEIYISIDRVKDNARVHQTSFREEILRVIFHGALHLCGYKDKTASQTKLMRQKEEEYIRLYLKA
jgi:rRNA maturation RNase YbeY